ncbi:uncharacterized protein EV422DRAFT_577406, partial [Fimicolochytrium jonesii]|uniref:uncharacterized protein n=1 Tax=Fimicolochytrium jonesii TaxID=1396493 RepID=UPI0022FF168B
MPAHQALQGHLCCGIFTGATPPRRKRRKVTPATPRLPTAVQTPLQPPRFEFPPSVQRHLPQAIADMVGESSGNEDGQQQQPQRGLSPADRADHPLHNFPDITDKHISVVFELLKNPGYNGNPVIAQELHPWVQDYCDVHGFAPIRMRKCQQTAAYTATSIFTNLKVNVQEHFMQMFLRYVNERLGLKQVERHLRRAQRRHYYPRMPISSVRIDTKILTTHILALGCHRMGKLTDQRKRELWGQFLNVNDKVFKDRKKLGLKFDGSISTNGYSATIHFKKPGLKYGHRARKRSKAQKQEEVKQLYFEHHIAELREAPNIVSIDPGKPALLFCRDIKKGRPFRYTSNQRAVETKSRYFQRDMTEQKINASIAEMESHMPSHKSMNIEAFSAFIVDHLHADPALDEFYQDEIHVACRFKAFSLRQKSETKLIKNMRRLYGKHFAVILGDWSDAGKTMRFQESSKTKGFRTLFARNSIPCYLLDEYRTSSVCPDCHGRVKKNIRRRLSPRPWQARKGRMEFVHGLVGCPNPECINQDWTPFEIPGRRPL